MNKHFTEIELFEFTNDLIEDVNHLSRLKNHLKGCEECTHKISLEKKMDVSLRENLAVKKEVDVSAGVLKYFEKPSVKMVGVDVSWVSLVVFFISALLIMGELTTINTFIPKFAYTTVIASAISALLLVDFGLKYWKNKKKTTA